MRAITCAAATIVNDRVRANARRTSQRLTTIKPRGSESIVTPGARGRVSHPT